MGFGRERPLGLRKSPGEDMDSPGNGTCCRPSRYAFLILITDPASASVIATVLRSGALNPSE